MRDDDILTYLRSEESGIEPEMVDKAVEGYRHPEYENTSTNGWVCGRCGAYVASRAAHNKFHRNLTIAIRLQGLMLARVAQAVLKEAMQAVINAVMGDDNGES